MQCSIDKLRESPHWSYSALNTYLNVCQLKFYFQYIERAEPERQPVCFPFGRAYHAVLTEQAKLAANGQSLTEANACDMFGEIFNIEVKSLGDTLILKDDESSEILHAKGCLMLKTALSHWHDFYNIKSVGEAFLIPVPGLDKPLIGEFDLIVEDGQDNCVVDWKTSSRKWSEDKAHSDFQATVFSYAYHKIHGSAPLFRFDVITKTKTPELTSHYTQRNADSFIRFEYLAHKVDDGVSKGVFMPNEGNFGCVDCPYASRCRKIHRT